MPFNGPVRSVVLGEVCFHIRSVLLLESRKSGLFSEKHPESLLPIHDALLYSFAADLSDPQVFRILWQEFIVQPFREIHSGHEAFFRFVDLFVFSNVEIVDEPADTDGSVYFMFLLLSRMYFRLVTFQHPDHHLYALFSLISLREL